MGLHRFIKPFILRFNLATDNICEDMSNRGPVFVQNNMDSFLLVQLAVVAIAALVAGLFIKWQISIGILSGGLAVIVPGWVFVKKLFYNTGATQADKIMRNLYLGEVLKLVLIGAISIVFLVVVKVGLLPFFVGFVAAQLAHWLAPFVAFRHKR